MSYAIRKDGKGWRAVNSRDDVEADEVFSEEQPAVVVDFAAEIRANRVPLLAQADAAINTADDNGQDAAALRRYRQALRDITNQAGFPATVEWPAFPK